MRRIHLVMIVTVAAAVTLTVGCTSPVPLRDDYGRSVTAMKRAQRPDAARAQGNVPVEGLDGQAAQAVIQTYRGTFDKGKSAGSSSASPQLPAGITESIGASGMPPSGAATNP